MEITVKAEMIAFLEETKDGKSRLFGNADEGFTLAVEAFQRGWIESAQGLIKNGTEPALIDVQGLSSLGWEILDAAHEAEQARRPSARLRRACSATVHWIFRSVEHVILALLCSDMVLRWLVFFFKD